MPAPIDAATIGAAPKVLLHDHLDGGLRPATVLELADEIGWTLPASDPASLQQWFRRGAESRDILQYLATFEHTVAVMQTADAIERVAAEAVDDLAADGVVYAEVRFAPELHQANGLSLDAVTDAVTAGYRRGEAEALAAGRAITVNAICCAMRTERRSMEIARFVDARRQVDDKVVAFDLAGAETGWPPSLHAEALDFARERHLNITIHASEPPDLELISDAIAHGAHRIGHGVRLQSDTSIGGVSDMSIGDVSEMSIGDVSEMSIGDVSEMSIGDDGELRLGPLARHVLDRRIHLEMAPTCNVQIGAVPAIAAHPIGAFLRAGFNVGVNTDNRLMSGVAPSSELLAVAHAFELTWAEIGTLVTNAANSAFAPYEQRARLVDEVIGPAFKSLSD